MVDAYKSTGINDNNHYCMLHGWYCLWEPQMGAYFHSQFKVKLSKIMSLFLSWTLTFRHMLFYWSACDRSHYFESWTCSHIFGLLAGYVILRGVSPGRHKSKILKVGWGESSLSRYNIWMIGRRPGGHLIKILPQESIFSLDWDFKSTQFRWPTSPISSVAPLLRADSPPFLPFIIRLSLLDPLCQFGKLSCILATFILSAVYWRAIVFTRCKTRRRLPALFCRSLV